MKRLVVFLLFSMAGFELTFNPAPVVSATPYYEGKIIEMQGTGRVGGGTDTMARITSRILPKYIPGRPKIVVRPLPGAGGAIVNNIFYERAKPDGLHLLMNASSAVALQRTGRDIVKYNMLHYRHIGNVSRGGNVLVVRKEAISRLTDPKAQPVVCGTQEGTENWLGMSMWGREFLGWNIRWIPGYTGGSEIRMAFQRAEIDMMGTSNVYVLNPLKEQGLAVFLTQTGTFKKGTFIRRDDFSDIPTFVETLGDNKPTGIPWQAYLGWVGGSMLDKFLSAPRGTPDEYYSILVQAWEKMSRDPEFDQLVKKMVSDVYEVGIGKETDELLNLVLDVPPQALGYGGELQRKFGIVSK
ncbi:MAG: tripartite tricarboxylate transporter substrate-binding protein [Dehalococcoidia bacterium]|nr:tripartite tricarboxylate transporter substrate-binding protein [Dehalococcoidia bacterium]